MIDISKKIEMCLLCDTYGNLLTEKQKQIFDMYYYEDLSLFEISEAINISRQGVRDSLVKAEQLLKTTEKKCGLAKKLASTKQELLNLQSSLNTGDAKEANISQKLHKIITEL